ncbi:hypothetical protein [Algicola sagamiensis]|uniref:hypothetical protein n=1 Tax=Algicola sagamiensis TaxID=163869 RepID=UPI000365460B|nr:hypothetical protein [Algicola sagamiensis]
MSVLAVAPLSTFIQPYQLQINQFLQKKPACQFTGLNISHRDFAEQLRKRVVFPWIIDQREAYLCGPNAYFFCLVSKKPDEYVKYVLDLWTHGEAELGNLAVKPSKACLTARVSSDDTRAADWIALASLRDATNNFFDFNGPRDGTAGITMPVDLAAWFYKTGFSGVRNQTNIVLNGSLENLQQAQRLFQGNHYVNLFISSKVIHLPKKAKLFPNHWVVLTSHILVKNKLITNYQVSELEEMMDEPVSLHVATWGLEQGRLPLHLANRRKVLTLGELLKFYFGYVAAL